MKKAKKLLAVLLMLVLLLSLVPAAGASSGGGETTPEYSITVENATPGVTYSAYKIFDVTVAVDTNGNAIGYNYKVDSAWSGFFTEKAGDNNDGLDFFELRGDYVVAKTGLVAATFALAAKDYALDTTNGISATVSNTVAAGSNTTVLDVKETGYYLIISTIPAAEEGGATTYGTPITQHVTSNAKTRVITDKSYVPQLSKTVDNSTISEAAAGDTAQFEIRIVCEKSPTNYVLTDTFGTPGRYAWILTGATTTAKKSGISISIEKAGDSSNTVNLTENTDYTIEITQASVTIGENTYNVESGFKITFLNDAETIKSINTNDVIVIKYSAALGGASGVLTESGNPGNQNTAVLTYPSGGSTASMTAKTNTYVYQVTINKKQLEEEGKTSDLYGATFKLEKKGTDGNYTMIREIGAGSSQATFNFTGLDVGTYRLVETKAPDGYTRGNDIEFTIVPTYDYDTLTLTSLAANGTDGNVLSDFQGNITEGRLTVTVTNTRGSNLPNTGGMGTTVFYAAGALLILGALALLAARRRPAAR